ncbi:hypothetical protein DFQ27_008516 [Actinomortierella ambigua]|uniref:Mediator of RNA polymerase II transcription subunit 1 n=1 Tax=Actinomortierella ambigua TaxID=1343610 RepID=A0A9P6PSK3_9FUNG|nr:hypothetical protein DFQ27_008516 [Actinomortierella ambigua]
MPDTADATTVQEHLRELQSLLQDSLKQWHLMAASASATPASTSSNPPRIPHGPLQKQFKEKIAAIRAPCMAFTQGPLQQAVGGGESGSSTAFRKYSSLLKEETLLEGALANVKSNLKSCQNLLRAASHDGNTRSDHILNTVKEMATSLGLECYLDAVAQPSSAQSVSTLTVGGTVIVIDIDVESTGTILRIKVSYASEIHQDERIDRLLVLNLQCKCQRLMQSDRMDGMLAHQPDCTRNFETFGRNLTVLATLDKLTKIYPHYDFFQNVRSLDLDFKEIYRREMLACQGNLEKVLLQAHGIPLMHAVYAGPSVAYWAPHKDLNQLDWQSLAESVDQGANEKINIPFHRLCFSMEETSSAISGYLPGDRLSFLLTEEEQMTMDPSQVTYGTLFDTASNTATPSRWIVPTVDATVQAGFVAHLCPPVAVAESVARELAALSNATGAINTMGYKRDFGFSSLQELLVEDNQNSNTHKNKNTANSSSTGQQNASNQWSTVVKQSVEPTRQLYSLDRRQDDGRLIQRIPFVHPWQIQHCLRLLRQQLVFNTLFQSCFTTLVVEAISGGSATASIMVKTPSTSSSSGMMSPPASGMATMSIKKENATNNSTASAASQPTTDSSLPEVTVTIQTPQAPHWILVSFVNPFLNESYIFLEIQVQPQTSNIIVRQRLDAALAGTGQIVVSGYGFASASGGASSAASVGGGGIGGGGGVGGGFGSGVDAADLYHPQPSHIQNAYAHLPVQDGVVMTEGSGGDANNHFVLDAATMTSVLETSQSIPVLVQWVLDRAVAWARESDLHQLQRLQRHAAPINRRPSEAEENQTTKRARV